MEDCKNAECPLTSFKGDKNNNNSVLLVENGDTKIYLEEKDFTGESRTSLNISVPQVIVRWWSGGMKEPAPPLADPVSRKSSKRPLLFPLFSEQSAKKNLASRHSWRAALVAPARLEIIPFRK